MSATLFGREHVALLTADEAAALDRRAREGGIPERALMENAGRAAAQVIQRLYPTGPVLAVVGSGNNGGDAMVALRSLQHWGREVAYMPIGSSAPDPALAAGLELRRTPIDDAPQALAGAGVIIDGILGTGVTGAPREPAATIIGEMNGAGPPIVALDIPSGVDPTTGAIPGVAVDAAATILFGWPKTGALFQPGRQKCGRLLAVEIGFPPLRDDEYGAALITPDWARARLPYRPPDSHKNSVGRVVVAAGRKGMAGAAVVAGYSAMRAGAGYARIVSDETNRTIIQGRVPAALFVDRADPNAIREAIAQADAVLVGPAIGTGDAGRGLLTVVLDALDGRGVVLDADALTVLAEQGGLDAIDGPALLTPHPGEMARLVDRSIAEIQADPMDAARSLAEAHGVTVLLKGAPSVVATPGAPVLVAATGSSDLATAAMGDQLGGLATAFLSAGATPAHAAGLALLYGGRAAELAGRGRSLTPMDVADRMHDAFAGPGAAAPPTGLPFVLFDQPPRW
ncbi:MAG: NAD(P)H-hydrate dehydratase [Candidatus Longimicrobiales bacterium M2_2A_002]